MFSDPLFTSLGVKQVRVVVSYDVMTSGDDELQRVTEYLLAARAAGIEPLVTFEHARGAAEICEKRKNRRKRQCRLPSAARVPARVQAVPQALRVRAHLRAVERDQPLHAADLPQPEGGGEVHRRIARKNCFGVQGRRRRHARPGRQHRAPRTRRSVARRATSSSFRQRAARHAAHDLRHPQLLGRQPLPHDRHEGDHQGARLQADLAHRDRRHLQVRRLQGIQRPPPAEGDEVHVQARAANKKVKRVYVYTWFGAHDPALRRRPGRARPSAARPTARSRSACAEADACSTA